MCMYINMHLYTKLFNPYNVLESDWIQLNRWEKLLSCGGNSLGLSGGKCTLFASYLHTASWRFPEAAGTHRTGPLQTPCLLVQGCPFKPPFRFGPYLWKEYIVYWGNSLKKKDPPVVLPLRRVNVLSSLCLTTIWSCRIVRRITVPSVLCMSRS